jgi:MraZ protein
MLIGKSYHSLDTQRRVTIPKTMRGEIGKNPVLTRGFDGGIFLLPEDFWQGIMNNLEHHTFTKKKSRDFLRLLSNDAYPASFDDLGRMTIPASLAEAFGITKEVVIVGSLQYIEVWDRDRYHSYLDGIADQAEEIAESIEWENHAHTSAEE